MTFSQWKKKYPKQVSQPYGKAGAVMVFTDEIKHYKDAKWKLHHLTDYVVTSSVSGPALVLVKVSRPKSKNSRSAR